MRPAVLNRESSVAPNPRLQPRKWWRKSPSTSGRIRPCSPGRSETDYWPRACVTTTRCPACHPSTGRRKYSSFFFKSVYNCCKVQEESFFFFLRPVRKLDKSRLKWSDRCFISTHRAKLESFPVEGGLTCAIQSPDSFPERPSATLGAAENHICLDKNRSIPRN